MVSFRVGSFSFFVLSRIFIDRLLDLSEQSFDSGDLIILEALVPHTELLQILFLTFFLQWFHVIINMNSENPVSMNLGIIWWIFPISLVSWESSGRVRNEQTSVTCSLHGSEHLVTSSGVDQSHIQDSLERSSFWVWVFSHIVVFTVNLSVGLVEGVHLQLLQ